MLILLFVSRWECYSKLSTSEVLQAYINYANLMEVISTSFYNGVAKFILNHYIIVYEELVVGKKRINRKNHISAANEMTLVM